MNVYTHSPDMEDG